MTIEHLRRYHRTSPFKPFRIYLADGRQVDVPHPEFLWIPPKAERVLSLPDKSGAFESIDLLLVVSLKELNGTTRSAGRRAQ